MKIALINGSPKGSNSASASLLSDLMACVSGRAEVTETGLHKTMVPEDVLEKLKNADAWVFACPLYVDGIPSHLLACLMQLEEICWPNGDVHIYGIVNCGFYEGIQGELALKILENWCIKAGFIWSGGVSVGGGGGLAQMPDIKNGHGPKAPVVKALRTLADNILQQEISNNHYVSVAFPRFLYKLAAQMGWRQMIKKNGGRTKDLGSK